MKRKARAASSGKLPQRRAELAIRSVRVEASGGPELIGKVLGTFLGPFLMGFAHGVAGVAPSPPSSSPALTCRCGHERSEHVSFENGGPSTACAAAVVVEMNACASPRERRERCKCSAFEPAR